MTLKMLELNVINECVECGESWTVYDSPHVEYNEIDVENYLKYSQIYSVCEDCNGGTCESVEKPQ